MASSSSLEPLSFGARLWLAWACYFRVLLDGAYAARVKAAGDGLQLPEKAPEATKAPEPKPEPEKKKAEGPPPTEAALQLLALLQREGRFVDFLEEDVSSFPDADIGAAARVVHTGCRKALRDHVKLEPVREEEEGARVSLPASFDPAEVKLTGNVAGKGPYAGTLRHRGWRAAEITLPTAVAGHDARVLAQAEVEL